MKAGSFNQEEYLNFLYEKAKKNTEKVKGTSGDAGEGIVIPPENRKAYDWLKKEYDKNKQEVKVEMTSAKFEPGYSTEGAKDFKPGVYTVSGTTQGYESDIDKKPEAQEANDKNIKIKFSKK